MLVHPLQWVRFERVARLKGLKRRSGCACFRVRLAQLYSEMLVVASVEGAEGRCTRLGDCADNRIYYAQPRLEEPRFKLLQSQLHFPLCGIPDIQRRN